MELAKIPSQTDDFAESLPAHIVDAVSTLLLGMPELRKTKAVISCGENPSIFCMAGSGRWMQLLQLSARQLAVQAAPWQAKALGRGFTQRG